MPLICLSYSKSTISKIRKRWPLASRSTPGVSVRGLRRRRQQRDQLEQRRDGAELSRRAGARTLVHLAAAGLEGGTDRGVQLPGRAGAADGVADLIGASDQRRDVSGDSGDGLRVGTAARPGRDEPAAAAGDRRSSRRAGRGPEDQNAGATERMRRPGRRLFRGRP
jgi:hypothetical protein